MGVNHGFDPGRPAQNVVVYVVKLFNDDGLFRYEYKAAERAWSAYRSAENGGRYTAGVIGTTHDNRILAQFDRSTKAAARQETRQVDRLVPKEDQRPVVLGIGNKGLR
jgi:hypothetical protein